MRRAISTFGSADGRMTLDDEPPAVEPEAASGLDHLAIHAANPEVGVGVHRQRTTGRNEDELERFVDAEPREVQRHQREERHGAQHLHRRVDERFTDEGQAREHTEHQTDGETETETDDHTPERGDDVVGQIAALPQPGERGPHLRWLGQDVVGDRLCGRTDPPDEHQHQRHADPQQHRHPTASDHRPEVRRRAQRLATIDVVEVEVSWVDRGGSTAMAHAHQRALRARRR